MLDKELAEKLKGLVLDKEPDDIMQDMESSNKAFNEINQQITDTLADLRYAVENDVKPSSELDEQFEKAQNYITQQNIFLNKFYGEDSERVIDTQAEQEVDKLVKRFTREVGEIKALEKTRNEELSDLISDIESDIAEENDLPWQS